MCMFDVLECLFLGVMWVFFVSSIPFLSHDLCLYSAQFCLVLGSSFI